MLFEKYFLVVTLLVFTSKTAQSFILLTANVADIKKIAQKFVSDELAGKLALTVVQVINNLNTKKGTNIDDELKKIEMPTDYKDKTYRNKKTEKNVNVDTKHKNDQQRFKKATRNPNDDFNFNDNEEAQSVYKDKLKKQTTKYLNNWEMNIKSEDAFNSKEDPKDPVLTEMKSVSHQQRLKRPRNSRSTKNPVEYTIHTTRQNHQSHQLNEVKSRYVPDLKPILGREPYANKKLLDNSPSPDQKRQKHINHFELPAANFDERSHLIDNIKKSLSDNKPAWKNQEIEKVTPKREKSEFDQYDNFNNYPKKGKYIATSGPIALPAMPIEKQWWEQDLPERRKNERK